VKTGAVAIMVAAGTFLAAAATAANTATDWSRAPLVDDGQLLWILQVDRTAASASYGHPESDHVVLTLSCDGSAKISASHVDPQFEPFSRYDIHLRAGPVEAHTTGTTKERMELDDLVDLSFLLPVEAKFLNELKAGRNLSILFKGPGKDHVGFTLPMPVVDLEPLFKACRL
jgi:hypothetical protein